MLDDKTNRAARAYMRQDRLPTIDPLHRLPPRAADPRWKALNRPVPPRLAGYVQWHMEQAADVEAGLRNGRAAWQRDYDDWLRHPPAIPALTGIKLVLGMADITPELLGIILAETMLRAGDRHDDDRLPRWTPACEFVACEHGIIHRADTEAPLTDHCGNADEALLDTVRDMCLHLPYPGRRESQTVLEYNQHHVMLCVGYTLWRCGGEVWDCGCDEAVPLGGHHHP